MKLLSRDWIFVSCCLVIVLGLCLSLLLLLLLYLANSSLTFSRLVVSMILSTTLYSQFNLQHAMIMNDIIVISINAIITTSVS